MSSVCRPEELFPLDMLAAHLKGFRPPQTPHDSAGQWQLAYGQYSLAAFSGFGSRVGTIHISRLRREADTFSLQLQCEKSTYGHFTDRLTAEIEARSQGLPQPLRWSWQEEIVDANAAVLPLGTLRRSAALQGGILELAGGKRKLAVAGPCTLNWLIFEAVGHLPREAFPPLRFTLIDDFDQVKPAHTLRYADTVTVMLGDHPVRETHVEELEKGRIHKTSWGRRRSVRSPARVPSRRRGQRAWVYWVDDQGRLLFAVSGIEAYGRSTVSRRPRSGRARQSHPFDFPEQTMTTPNKPLQTSPAPGTSTRRRFLQAGALAAAGSVGGLAGQAWPAPAVAAKRPPNFLFLISDQLGLDAIAALGGTDARTPHLDRLIRRGATFLESHCGNPVCSPSRSSLFTGRMPVETGVVDNSRPIHASRPNMGQWLQQSGYQTVYSGKWHLPSDTPVPGFLELPASGGQGIIADGYVTRACEAYLHQRERNRPFLLVGSLLEPHDICFWAIQGQFLVPAKQPFADIEDQLPPLPVNHLSRPLRRSGWNGENSRSSPRSSGATTCMPTTGRWRRSMPTSAECWMPWRTPARPRRRW